MHRVLILCVQNLIHGKGGIFSGFGMHACMHVRHVWLSGFVSMCGTHSEKLQENCLVKFGMEYRVIMYCVPIFLHVSLYSWENPTREVLYRLHSSQRCTDHLPLIQRYV